MRSADIGTFLPIEREPAQIAEHHLFRFARRTRLIGVFDAQDERAAVPLREKPIENRGAHATNVKMSRWRRREANTNGQGRTSIATIAITQMPSSRPMNPR